MTGDPPRFFQPSRVYIKTYNPVVSIWFTPLYVDCKVDRGQNCMKSGDLNSQCQLGHGILKGKMKKEKQRPLQYEKQNNLSVTWTWYTNAYIFGQKISQGREQGVIHAAGILITFMFDVIMLCFYVYHPSKLSHGNTRFAEKTKRKICLLPTVRKVMIMQ